MIAKKIKEYLEKRGITQSFIWKNTNIPRWKTYAILSGKRAMNIDEYVQICDALSVDINTFVNNENEGE